MMDRIILNNLRVDFSIGLTHEERKKKRSISIYLELFLDTKKSAQHDDIKYTIDYRDVCKLINELALKKEYRLIEALAEEIAGILLKNFNTKKVVVTVAKKNIHSIPNLGSASVEISREK